ncbi:Rossmann-fold NAD(P)-binding domain-containing protein [Marimonas lutisalis]|uniref:dTDP-glucose 4,6-dehydratase n=1 Tax=Marimonas lutisalis TaxID=2545756 RepID=UPI002E26460C
MLELADLVLELTGSQSKLVFWDLPVDDPRQRRPDITRAGKLLGWAPRVPLRDRLGPTIAYYRSELARRQLGFGDVA